MALPLRITMGEFDVWTNQLLALTREIYGEAFIPLHRPVFEGNDHPGAMAEIRLPRAVKKRSRTHVPMGVAPKAKEAER